MKTFFYKTITVLILTIPGLPAISIAQGLKPTTTVQGTVTDEQGKAMSFASVALIKAKDSALVKGAVTNEDGNFNFQKVNAGAYLIRVNVMGYAKGLSQVFVVTSTPVNLPALKLALNAKALKDVNVTANKPLIERKIDRTVMNVENSVLAAGNSAMEILEKAPGVSVDKDDNISLKGKQGVTVMIDDKLTYLSSAQLATLLRSTDGNTIQSIEIITNPSAKYDAAGNSGIINIKLKKNKSAGTNGSVSFTGAIGVYPKENGSITLNHKQGSLNFFGTYSEGDRKRDNDIFIYRDVFNANGSESFYSQHTFMPKTSYNNTYRFGMDYDMSKKNTIGFLVNGYFNGEHDNNVNNTYIGSKANVSDSVQNTYSTIDQTYRNFAANLNDKWSIDTAGQELSADLDYSKFTNKSDARYNTYYFLPNNSELHIPALTSNQSPTVINIHTGKVDYSLPLSKSIKFEPGVKISHVNTDNDLEAQIYTNKQWINDAGRTNHFIYDEKINAAYVNLSKTWKNTSIQLGLRAEQTHSIGNLLTQSTVDTSYIDLFPSLFINRTLSDKHEIGFSYSRRIDRPDYENLNPFVYYLDPLTFGKGNPFLKPQYTQSLEFNYTYNKSVNVSLSYSYTTNPITQVILPGSVKPIAGRDSTYQTTVNLESQVAYNANINTPYRFADWWQGNANLNGFYMHFKADHLPAGVTLNDGQASFQFKTSNTFSMGKTWRAEVSTDYQSPLTYGLLKIQTQYSVDGGLSHSFANKKANVKFSVSDIFNTLSNKVSSVYTGETFNIYQKNETRVFRLTGTWNFGNSKIKARQHTTGLEEEKNRVKTGN